MRSCGPLLFYVGAGALSHGTLLAGSAGLRRRVRLFKAAVMAAYVQLDRDLRKRKPFTKLADKEPPVFFGYQLRIVHKKDKRRRFYVGLRRIINLDFLGGGGAGAAEGEDFFDG